MYLVKSNLKEDGKKYVAGDEYNGHSAEHLLEIGVLEEVKQEKKAKKEEPKEVKEEKKKSRK